MNSQNDDWYYRGDLEIVNCRKREMALNPGFYDVISTGISRLSVHGCIITIKDVWDALQVSDGEIHSLDFQGDIFISNKQNWKLLNDISDSNFNDNEKKELKDAFKDKIQLIL